MARAYIPRLIAAAVAALMVLATLGALTAGAQAAKAPVYILNGYSLDGLWGVDTTELAKKLPHKEGDRVTEADAVADGEIVKAYLHDRHVKGHVVTSLATKRGHVWFIYDLLNGDHSPVHFGKPPLLLSQKFDGASRLSADALAKAAGLKIGDALPHDKIKGAHQALIDAYARAMPGKAVTIKARLQIIPGEKPNPADKTTPADKVNLTWLIVEPK